MKPFLYRSLCLGCFLFAINFCNAQPVVTEYFVMKTGFKIDLTDRKVQKSVYVKGVLDIVWSTSDSNLSITYDPKVTDTKEVMRSIQDFVNTTIPNIHTQATKAE
jgi:hypothetical protein